MKTTTEIIKIILDSMAPDNDDIFQVHMKNRVSYDGIVIMSFLAKPAAMQGAAPTFEVSIWWADDEGEDQEATLDVTQIAEIYVMVKDAEILTFVPIK